MVFADLLPYICAILALLFLWQYYQNQILAGRIQAADISDRSGIRMYLCATPDDEEICESCREVNGMVFLPSRVARREFTPLRAACSNKGRCTIVIVGLYGAWPDASQVLRELRAAGKEGFVHLSFEELVGLTKGSWQASVSAATDRLGVGMLAALCSENEDPEAAASGYREIIQQAQEVHDLPLVVPAYLRLTTLLDRQDHSQEAIALIEDFERRYPQNKTGPYYPNKIQRGLLTIKKSRLRTALPSQPPPIEQTSPSAAEDLTIKSAT